jgi:ParB/RepB/Spo0J family partition protein
VRELAEDIVNHGQIQPIEIRRLADDVYSPVSGYTRCAAILLINSDPELRALAKLGEDDIFPIKCVTTRANEKESFLRSLAENRERNDTSPIDDAHAQHKMRERFGMSNVEIAKVFRCTPAWISELANLLDLDDDQQRLVHDKVLSSRNAIDLTRLMPDQRRELISEVMIQPESIPMAINSVNNDSVTDHEPSEPQEPTETQPIAIDNRQLSKSIREARGKTTDRTLKEIKDTLREITEESAHSEAVRVISGMMWGFVTGEKEIDDVLDAISEYTHRNRENRL